MSGFIYLATPYTRYPLGRGAAFTMACRVAAHLMRSGVVVFSPIAHSHPIAQYGDLDPNDHGIWLPADRPMMDAACALLVFQAAGWAESKGVAHEIDVFRAAGKPVHFMSVAHPLVIPGEVLP